MIEVISIKECFGKTDDYKTLKITDPRLQWNNMPQLAAKLSTEGVRVQCADATFVLPLSLVNRILGDLTELNIPTAQTDETLIDNEEKLLSSEQSDKIPVIDCVKLIKPDSGECANTYLLLSLACGYVIIGVSRTALQPTLPEQQWSKLALLPPPSSLFFDAATFDDVDKKWVLRIKADIDFSLFPWHIKRQCVTALVSWIDEKYLEEIDV